MLNANAEASGSQSAVEALESPRAAEGAVAEGKGMSKNAQKKAARMVCPPIPRIQNDLCD